MSTRREFLTFVAATGVAVSSATVQAAKFSGKTAKIQHGDRARIRSLIRRDETILRPKSNHGSFHMTWADNDRQYVTLNDGFGCCDNSNVFYNNHLYAISGGPQDVASYDVPGYPKKTMAMVERGFRDDLPDKTAWYNAWGTVALDKHIYVFVSTFNHPSNKPDGSPWPNVRFVGAKLIYSPDNGRTWHNQDGSTPVMWEPYDRHSPETIMFFEEPQGAFCLLSILQMGRNYGANRDGYIYVYAPNGNTEGTMNELVMFRVPKGQLLHRDAYEFFAGLRSNGDANWVKDITAREVVHTFPRNWIGTAPSVVPFGWFPSVVYNAPLDLYLMANWGQGSTPDEVWFGKPSYLGFWVASQPWGPWRQIHEETAWLPAGDQNARAYQPQIAPKWIAKDGKSFWLAWDEFQIIDQQAYQQLLEERKRITSTPENEITPEDEMRMWDLLRRAKPYYGMNRQRVDLVLA